MKATKYIILLLVLLVSSCHSDDYVEMWAGNWRVDSFAVNGVEQSGEPQLTTFSFHSDIVRVQLSGKVTRFGTWSEFGSCFTLNFMHSDNNTAPGSGQYAAPEWLGMTSDEPMQLIIESRSSRNVVMRRTADDGTVYTYKLHKIG